MRFHVPLTLQFVPFPGGTLTSAPKATSAGFQRLLEQNVPQHQGSPGFARDSLAPDMVAGGCQGLWLEGRKGASLSNGLMPAYSRVIWLGYPNLILAQPGQVVPLLRLLVLREDLSPSPHQLTFQVPHCTLASWPTWILCPPNATVACLAWSLNHQAYSFESPPRGKA